MGRLHFKRLANEREELIDFYTMNNWEYHADPHPEKDEIAKRFDCGWYKNDRETFWVIENGVRIRLVVLEDMDDTMPMLYDLRLAEQARGKGYGIVCLKWVVDYVFSSSVEKLRIEAYTRYDNYPMRKTFYHCGFQKQGYLRKSWENDDGSVVDSVVYAIIRSDWVHGVRSETQLDDVPF